jgi:predicted phosphodiesterase
MSLCAIVADIHGNARALEAVLFDMRRRGISVAMNLGDTLYGPFDPTPVANHMAALGVPTVSGNEDRALVEAFDGCSPTPMAGFALERMGQQHLDRLRTLPPVLEFDGLLLCHGTPTCDSTYLLSEVVNGSLLLGAEADIARRAGESVARTILCGHDHTPRVVRLADGRLLLNPGSVGCPAFEDSKPTPHRMEMGSPHARYAILDREAGTAEFVSVNYDWDAAAAEARHNGFPAWARWLRTGRTQGTELTSAGP